jgi:hypothetical protein
MAKTAAMETPSPMNPSTPMAAMLDPILEKAPTPSSPAVMKPPAIPSALSVIPASAAMALGPREMKLPKKFSRSLRLPCPNALPTTSPIFEIPPEKFGPAFRARRLVSRLVNSLTRPRNASGTASPAPCGGRPSCGRQRAIRPRRTDRPPSSGSAPRI